MPAYTGRVMPVFGCMQIFDSFSCSWIFGCCEIQDASAVFAKCCEKDDEDSDRRNQHTGDDCVFGKCLSAL